MKVVWFCPRHCLLYVCCVLVSLWCLMLITNSANKAKWMSSSTQTHDPPKKSKGVSCKANTTITIVLPLTDAVHARTGRDMRLNAQHTPTHAQTWGTPALSRPSPIPNAIVATVRTQQCCSSLRTDTKREVMDQLHTTAIFPLTSRSKWDAQMMSHCNVLGCKSCKHTASNWQGKWEWNYKHKI